MRKAVVEEAVGAQYRRSHGGPSTSLSTSTSTGNIGVPTVTHNGRRGNNNQGQDSTKFHDDEDNVNVLFYGLTLICM